MEAEYAVPFSLEICGGSPSRQNVEPHDACKETTAMADGDLHEQIAQIEADIEQLAQTLDRCRKAMLASQVAIGAGAICVSGLPRWRRHVWSHHHDRCHGCRYWWRRRYGSNASTSKEAAAAMKNAERLRAELIDKIDPRTIRDDRPPRSRSHHR